jgi:hypothetical protein
MKKLISFKKLKYLCYFIDTFSGCCDHIKGGKKKCCSKNCPIWRELKGLNHDRP